MGIPANAIIFPLICFTVGKMHWVVACDSQGNRRYRRPHTDTGVYQRKFGGNVYGPKTNLENPGVDHSQRIWSMDVSSKFTLIDARISVKQAIESVPLRVTGYHTVHFPTV